MQTGANFESLAHELTRLLDVGTTASIVRVTIEGTTNDVYFGLREGQLHLDYWAPGLRGLWYRWRFKCVAAKSGLRVTMEQWGTKRVARVATGSKPHEVAGLAKHFLHELYGAKPGTFLLTIQPWGYSAT